MYLQKYVFFDNLLQMMVFILDIVCKRFQHPRFQETAP